MTDFSDIDRPHLREMIESGTASVLPMEFSKQIYEHMNSLPCTLSGQRLDARQIENSEILDWMKADDDEVFRWAQKLRTGTILTRSFGTVSIPRVFYANLSLP